MGLYRTPGGKFFFFHDSDYGRRIELPEENTYQVRDFVEEHGTIDDYQGCFGVPEVA